jgi:hypothetical protein
MFMAGFLSWVAGEPINVAFKGKVKVREDTSEPGFGSLGLN